LRFEMSAGFGTKKGQNSGKIWTSQEECKNLKNLKIKKNLKITSKCRQIPCLHFPSFFEKQSRWCFFGKNENTEFADISK
jgi:hypothetical protein